MYYINVWTTVARLRSAEAELRRGKRACFQLLNAYSIEAHV
jgi:hypothetical protein